MAKIPAKYEAQATDPVHGLPQPATVGEVAAGGFVILAMPVGTLDQLVSVDVFAELIGAVFNGINSGTEVEMLAILSPADGDRFTIMESTDEATWPTGFYKYDAVSGAWVQTG